MQAVILAAGRGVRMGDLTDEIPKPLLKISNRPILEYTLNNLPEEISEIIFVIGYKGEMIKKYFGNEFNGKKIVYVEQEELNGTAGALWVAKDILRDKFLVLMADDLYHKPDLEKLLAYDLALLVKEVANNTRFGVVAMDESGCLKEVVEYKFLKGSPAGNLVNMGAYVLNPKIFDYAPFPISAKEFGLPQTLAQMADKHKIKVIRANVWHPNGQEEDLIKGEAVVKKHFN